MARKAEHDEADGPCIGDVRSDELRWLEKMVSDKPNPAGLSAGHVNVQGGVDVQGQGPLRL